MKLSVSFGNSKGIAKTFPKGLHDSQTNNPNSRPGRTPVRPSSFRANLTFPLGGAGAPPGVPPAPVSAGQRPSAARWGAVKKLKIGSVQQGAGAPAPLRWNVRSPRVFGCGFRTVMSGSSRFSFSQLQADGTSALPGISHTRSICSE